LYSCKTTADEESSLIIHEQLDSPVETIDTPELEKSEEHKAKDFQLIRVPGRNKAVSLQAYHHLLYPDNLFIPLPANI
jgi:hypothetical protein